MVFEHIRTLTFHMTNTLLSRFCAKTRDHIINMVWIINQENENCA
eukprot:UN28463